MNTEETFKDVGHTEDRGPYILTNSGTKFHPFNPSEDEVDIYDIACSLAMKCRWNGHIDHFYSVAQHSIEVMKQVAKLTNNKRVILQALMHDAAEAYCVDMPTPLKTMLPDFVAMENNISACIARRFGYAEEMHETCSLADKTQLYRESHHLFNIDSPYRPNHSEDMINLLVMQDLFPSTYYEPGRAALPFVQAFNKLTNA